MNESIFSLKTTSATRIYTNIDVPEKWKLIERYEMSIISYVIKLYFVCKFKYILQFLTIFYFFNIQIFKRRKFAENDDFKENFSRIIGETNVS
jgi:hypothetical protein